VKASRVVVIIVSMKLQVGFILLWVAFAAVLTEASNRYQSNGNGYQKPQEEGNNIKLNLGVNVPAMSIKLPKLELPQITIRASIKQRKQPFRLQLPQISFSAHGNTDDEEEQPANYDNGNNGYQQQTSYSGGGGYGGNGGDNYAAAGSEPASGQRPYGGNAYEEVQPRANGGYQQQQQSYAPQQSYGQQGYQPQGYQPQGYQQQQPQQGYGQQSYGQQGGYGANQGVGYDENVENYKAAPVPHGPPRASSINSNTVVYGSRVQAPQRGYGGNNGYQKRIGKLSEVQPPPLPRTTIPPNAPQKRAWAATSQIADYQPISSRFMSPLVQYSSWRPVIPSHY